MSTIEMKNLEKALEARSKKVNKVETTKALKRPMDVYAKLEEIAAAGYEGLAKEDSAYFLKCFGLFDKGEDFMLRVRVPAGQLNYEQAKRIGEVALKYGDDYIDFTTRMQLELRYLQIEDIAKVLAELKEVGISTFQTGVDNPRNIVTDPLDGIAYDNVIETMPIIKKLQDVFGENPEWISTLPRKFNTGVLGSLSNSCNIFGHDCNFVLAQKDGVFGFNIYLGARVGMQAQDVNLFVHVDEVPLFFTSLLTIFKNYGYRDNRNKNRLVFLLNDVGIENFIDAVKLEAKEEFTTAGTTMVQSQNIALGSNKVLGRNGKFNYKVIVPSGIYTGSHMIDSAKLAKEFGSGDIRLTYDQNLYIVNIDKEKLEAFESTDLIQHYAAFNNLYFADMIACAGTKTCSFGVIPNKPDAIEMAHFLSSEVAIDNATVRMNWSACPKGCGVHGIADIGFEGCKAKLSDGTRVDGVHIFLGGKITREAKEAHTLHKALPITEAKYHVKYLLKPYAEHKLRAETYEAFDDRFLSRNYSFQALAFYTKINYVLNEKLGLDTMLELEAEPKSSKREEYELFSFGLKLYKLLTGEKRYDAVLGLHANMLKPTSIKRDTVSTLNDKVPAKLSEIIYNMTHENKKERAAVFSELLVALKEIKELPRTVCSYCGVGCKFEIEEEKLKGLKNYPVNKGLSCAKGISLTDTIETNRLLETKIRKDIKDDFQKSTYDESLNTIAQAIKGTDPKRIGFYLSGQMLNEDYYVANKLAKGFVGTANCDTNSRTCMSSAVEGYKLSYGVDYVPVRIQDIDYANLLILIGSNAAESHVVLFNKIKKAQKKGLKVVVIDPRYTLTAKIADIYLPLNVGADIDLFNLLSQRLVKDGHIHAEFIQNHANGFDDYKEKLLALDEDTLLDNSGISQTLFNDFYTLFTQSQNIITAWTMGVNQSIQGVDKNLAIHNLHIITGQINKQGCGPFSLTGQPNAMGGREVGGLSTTLAVHLPYTTENCEKVATFWESEKLPKANGLTAFEMIEKAHEGELDILIICHTDPVYHLPNRHFVEQALKKVKLVVEINAYEGSESSKFAHICIPSLPFGAKEGTQTNMDRTLTRVVPYKNKNGLLQDWEIFAKIGKFLGHEKAFDFKNSKDVFEEYKEMTRLSKNSHIDIYHANYAKMVHTPYVWGESLFKNNVFMTDNQKANLYFVENKNLSEQISDEYPFVLITGRTRDQWHSGSKTLHSQKLLKFKPLEFIEMNPDDAKKLNIAEGETVKVSSLRASIETIVIFSTIKSQTIFMPLSHKNINYLTNSKLDPISKEPDYNHSAIKVEKL